MPGYYGDEGNIDNTQSSDDYPSDSDDLPIAAFQKILGEDKDYSSYDISENEEDEQLVGLEAPESYVYDGEGTQAAMIGIRRSTMKKSRDQEEELDVEEEEEFQDRYITELEQQMTFNEMSRYSLGDDKEDFSSTQSSKSKGAEPWRA